MPQMLDEAENQRDEHEAGEEERVDRANEEIGHGA